MATEDPRTRGNRIVAYITSVLASVGLIGLGLGSVVFSNGQASASTTQSTTGAATSTNSDVYSGSEQDSTNSTTSTTIAASSGSLYSGSTSSRGHATSGGS